MIKFARVFGSYLLGHNKYLVEFLARKNSILSSNFDAIYQFLLQSFISSCIHPSFLYQSPERISENFPDTKMITGFCLSYYIEFIITSARSRFLGWQNNILLLSPYWGLKGKHVFIFLFQMQANEKETFKLLKWLSKAVYLESQTK